MKKPKLIFIGGSPWVGKSACAQKLFVMLDNAAWLDGDDVWKVNPFSLKDPRLRNGDRNIAYVLQTYLDSGFQYVICSSVVLTIPKIRKKILKMITFRQYELLIFILQCDQETLQKRCMSRDQLDVLDYQWADLVFGENEILIDTTNETPEQTAQKIKRILKK